MAGPTVKQNIGRYWWAGIALFLLVAGWTAIPLLTRSPADVGVEDIGPAPIAATDLNSLGDGLNAEDGAPGHAFGKDGEERRDNIELLKGNPASESAPPADGAPSAPQSAPSPDVPAAPKESAVSPSRGYDGSSASGGGGDKSQRSFNVASLPGAGPGGAGSRSAPLSGISGGSDFFGKGGAKNLEVQKGEELRATGAPKAPESLAQKSVAKLGNSAAEAKTNAFSSAPDESVKAASGKTFGEDGGKGGAGSGGGGGGALTQLRDAADTPSNLKENAPGISAPKKNFDPPKPKPAQQNNSSKDAQSQMMTQIMMSMLQSLLGPLFGGLGNAMASGMGLDPPKLPQGMAYDPTTGKPVPIRTGPGS